MVLKEFNLTDKSKQSAQKAYQARTEKIKRQLEAEALEKQRKDEEEAARLQREAQVKQLALRPSMPPASLPTRWWCHCCRAKNESTSVICSVCGRGKDWAPPLSMGSRPLHHRAHTTLRVGQVEQLMNATAPSLTDEYTRHRNKLIERLEGDDRSTTSALTGPTGDMSTWFMGDAEEGIVAPHESLGMTVGGASIGSATAARRMERILNDYDDQGWTPLHAACRSGSVDLARFLIDQGALVRARTTKGWRAIHIAAYYAHPIIVRMLLACTDCQVEPRTDVEQNTPLHLGAMGGSTEVIDLLIKSGAEVNCQNHIGSSPLHLAAQHNHPNCVTRLIKHGADMELKDKELWTARQIAEMLGHSAVEERFINALCSEHILKEDLPDPWWHSQHWTAVRQDQVDALKRTNRRVKKSKTYKAMDEAVVQYRETEAFKGHLARRGVGATVFDYDHFRNPDKPRLLPFPRPEHTPNDIGLITQKKMAEQGMVVSYRKIKTSNDFPRLPATGHASTTGAIAKWVVRR